jgi:membrane protease YdiL (CAAX protease family)
MLPGRAPVFLVFELSQLVTGLLLGIAVGIYAAAIDRAHVSEVAARMQGALNVVASFCGTLLGGGIAFRMVSRFFQALPRSEAKGHIGWRGASKGYCLWGAWCGLILALLYLSVGAALFPPNPNQCGPLTAAASTPGWPRHAWAILAVLLAPVIEEFVFRGVLFSGLSHSWGPMAGGGLTTLLFTGAHAASFTPYWPSLLSICVLGLAALAVRVRSRSLAPGMAMHSAYNLTLVVFVYAQSG